MEEVGLQQHLWLQKKPKVTNFFKPTTPFVFTQEENKFFRDYVTNIHAPTRYSIAFRKHVGPKGCLP
jgi:hypothetical protein